MTTPLTTELVGDAGLRIVRSFDAAPQRVWDAHWKPELVTQWMLGPEGWTMPVCEIEPRVGAEIRFRWENPAGEGFGMHGVVDVVEEPVRSVHTELFEFPGATKTSVETLFHPDGSGTRLEVIITYASAEAREAAMATGMTEGIEASYARLDSL